MKRINATAAAIGLALLTFAPAGAQTLSQLAAGNGLTLDEVYAAKINRESGHDEHQATPGRGATAARFEPAAQTQLVAAAGLEPGEAEGLSLDQVFALKTSRNARNDERQMAGDARYAWLTQGAKVARGSDLDKAYAAKINRESGRDGQQSSRY